MAEKSEKATPKKLRDAREKGQVAKSQDFPSAFTFIVSISTILLASTYIYNMLTEYMLFIFKSVPTNIDLKNRAGGFMVQSLMVILQASLPVLLITLIIGVLVSFLITGPVFSMQAMKPDIKRLNPVDNIKQKFKFKTLFELLKSVLKISGALLLIYSVVYNSIPEITAAAALPVVGIAQVFSDFLFKVIVRVGIFFLIIAIMDLIYQKRNFANEMKMEKFQVKQEYKDMEGDPQIKGKRRQMAQEIAYQDGPSAAKKAKALLTNPTHIAVAIGYDEDVDPSPYILFMGEGHLAHKLILIAEENGIPIVHNPPLARKLYYEGDISCYIPEATYSAVGEILQHIKTFTETHDKDDINIELFT